MDVFVDPTDRRGLSAQLYGQLRDAIVDGRLVAGDQLTPSRQLALDLGVSRFTVTEAYGRLAAEGFVDGQAGGGSIVAGTGARPTTTSRSSALVPLARAAELARFDRYPLRTTTFDLRPGRVDPKLFPADTWRRCMVGASRQPPAQYSDPAGTIELREALARWVGRSRGVMTSGEGVVVTSGAQHGMDLLMRVLVEPGDVVAVEDPGYPPVAELFRFNGARVVAVPVDEHGLVVDALPPTARLVYVTPSHQYPLGVTMSYRRRTELLRWADERNAAVIEDDYDSEFRHDARPLEPLHRLDTDGRVLYVGTFSKTLLPSLRVGFVVAPPPVARAMTALRQMIDWCPPTTTEAALTDFVDNGHLDRHIRRARRVYRDRSQRLQHALGERLSVPSRVLPSSVGLHLTVLLESGPDDLVQVIARHGLLIGSLRASYRSVPPSHGFIVGFGALPTDDIDAAVDALDQALVAACRGSG